MVSLYKLSVVDFNNLNGLKDVKDGVFFKATDTSGLPTFNVSDSVIIPEALEKSNTWIKVEAHNLTDAQRYFQAASQVHKLADKISGTAIEMIQ
jgi:flagellar hook protein FlgE